MHELSILLQNAFLDVADRLSRDPAELTRRLARRRNQMLMRPVRAHCLTLRATDARLWEFVTPKENEGRYPSKPFDGKEQNLRIDHYAMEALTRPVVFPNGETFKEAARMLGRSVREIRIASRQPNPVLKRTDLRGSLGVMPYDKQGIAWCREHGVGLDSPEAKRYAKGRPKWVVRPSPDPEAALDPSAGKLSYRPDPAFRPIWEALVDRVPDDFVARLRRVYRNNTWTQGPARDRRSAEHEADGEGEPPRRRRCAPNIGWFWLCSICGMQRRMLYLPLRMITLPEYFRARMERDAAERTFWPAPALACGDCHGVNTTRTASWGWNAFVTVVSEGLLYGNEVPRPEFLRRARVRTTTEAGTIKPQARPAVLTPRHEEAVRLTVQGNATHQVAKLMGLSASTAQRLVHRAFELMGDAAPPRPKRNGPTPQVGPADHDIVRFVALGMSHRAVARALGVKPRRVQHVLDRARRQRARAAEKA